MHEVVVSMKNIVKSFYGVNVLENVQLELRSGEVTALLGENGAGKSTLMKILCGAYTRDSGTVEIFGQQYGDITPTLARQLGIAVIHQELNLCKDLTVAENIFLGQERGNPLFNDDSYMNRRTREILSEMNMDILPTDVVGDLPVSKQQMVEVARVLSNECKILIMDEPTSALTEREIKEMFALIHRLKEKGCAIVYISHRLEELQHITDNVTIMRDGKYITSAKFNEISMDNIITNMVGHEIKVKYPTVSCEKGEKIFEIQNLCVGRLVKHVDFSVYAGEIVGISGLVGAGRTETLRAIFGVDRKRKGKIFIDGKRYHVHSPRKAIKCGIVLAPEDRQKDGLCTELTVRENISLPNLKKLSFGGLIVSRRREDELCKKAIKTLKIKARSPESNASNLSGGNQQKVVVGKWLDIKSRVVMFDEPTRGMDVGAKVEIYNFMNQLKQQGIGVVFVSSELPEILGIADRILVMCDGRITGELMRKEATQEKILTYATMFEDRLKKGVK